MEHIEDDSSVTGVPSVPTYYWANIQNPRLKGMDLDFLFHDRVVTQKVHPNGTGTKNSVSQPACVIYDSKFLQYKLLEILAPIICDWKNADNDGIASNLETGFDEQVMHLNDLIAILQTTLENLITQSLTYHADVITSCNEIGIGLGWDAPSLLRTFKQTEGRRHRHIES